MARLGLNGYGVRPTGSFSGKTLSGSVRSVGKITRPGLNGYGVRPTGSFSGKTLSGSVRSVGKITRPGLNGFGVERAGLFSGKTLSDEGGDRSVGIITRLGLNGFASKRAGIFSGKKESEIIFIPLQKNRGGGGYAVKRTYEERPDYEKLKHERFIAQAREEDEIAVAIIAMLLTQEFF